MVANNSTTTIRRSAALDIISKIVRVLTIAPLGALAALSILFGSMKDVFSDAKDFLVTTGLLTVLPVLAYPLQKIIPALRRGGREMQRNLAMAAAVLGYVVGIIYAFASPASGGLRVIFATYLLAGILIVVFNKLFHIRASGHACGVAGPIALLVYYFGPSALWGLLALAVVYWASLRMKRHTLPELIWGTLIPVFALGACTGIGALLFG